MRKKIEVLSKKMKKEQALLGDRLEPELLHQAVKEGRAVFIEANSEIIAFAALWPAEQSMEMGSSWVDPEHRGKGFASELFERRLALVPANLPLFLLTRSPQVVHLAKKHGMLEASEKDWFKFIPWSASCGPCDRLPEAEKAHCPFRAVHTECRLFVRA